MNVQSYLFTVPSDVLIDVATLIGKFQLFNRIIDSNPDKNTITLEVFIPDVLQDMIKKITHLINQYNQLLNLDPHETHKM